MRGAGREPFAALSRSDTARILQLWSGPDAHNTGRRGHAPHRGRAVRTAAQRHSRQCGKKFALATKRVFDYERGAELLRRQAQHEAERQGALWTVEVVLHNLALPNFVTNRGLGEATREPLLLPVRTRRGRVGDQAVRWRRRDCGAHSPRRREQAPSARGRANKRAGGAGAPGGPRRPGSRATRGRRGAGAGASDSGRVPTVQRSVAT
jgi:hypothetical protein